jgi:hypothetical protein
MKTRKLDHSPSRFQFLFLLQFLKFQKYQLQFPTRRKQNDG